MLTNRQIKILQHLLIHSFYGTELAKVMKTSRRTIIRDISTIDDWLRENNYGYIDSSKKYLIVTKRDKALKIEIQKLKVQKYRILYQLLSCKNISISEITEKFFSSKRDIESIIKNLNEEYRHLFTISIQPRKGILINLSTYERINLIASLLFSFVNLNIDTYEAKKILTFI
ncbi:HTH domain-containing protein [Pediococcus pentosaceus]|uniref:HTH domain-containing protein n=1 Tax=Pediococcus pentosaceus TaxID=1255 RepID=UPI001E2DDDE6